jgi:hypothetical protein
LQRLETVQQLPKESNCDIALKALKELGGVADRDTLYHFLWNNRERFERHGRPWSQLKANHELNGLINEGRIFKEKIGVNRYRYWVSPEELWL